MEIQDLINLNFDGPYPHGEYYLFDEEYARQDNGWCCIMCVYPDYYSDGSHMLHYNSERCLWSNPESNFFRSGEIKFNSLDELMQHIEKSKNLKHLNLIQWLKEHLKSMSKISKLF